MKRTQHVWLIGLGVVACLACMIGGLSKTPVQAQTATDDGLVTIYVYLDYDSNNVVYGSSYFEEDPFLDIGAGAFGEPVWNLYGGSYNDVGGGAYFSSGPVPVGNTYTAAISYTIEYGPNQDDGSCGDVDCFDYPTGYASIYVPYPPATVTGISPSEWVAGQSYQRVQITGTNFGSTPTVTLSDPTIQISQPYGTSTSNGISTTLVDITWLPSDTPSEPVTVTIAPGSNGSSFVSGTGGSLSGSSTADVIGAQQNACPQGVDANSGFSSITPTGLAPGGSGSIAVSFSHGSYNGFGVTVPYGPYSTPESIASHLAALITKQYASSGLMAQADGANILYKSNATLGNANFTPSGSSSDSPFAANPSPAACPSVNLTYILAVTTDSVVWKLQQGSSGQQGRAVTYALVKKPTADLPTNLFQHPSLPYTDSISEHFTKPGWTESTNKDNTGEFDDVLGTASVCPSCIIGKDTNYRYFTGILNNQNLGTLLIYDRTGAHKYDYIQIIHPSGPTILNHWTECKLTPTPPNCDDNKPEDISLPNTF